MRMRAKALTVAAAMVTTFAILPTFGAAAAEPLEDGSYAVTVGGSTYTVEVVEGVPAVEGAEGVEFVFAYDEETGRVLDEFDVAAGDTTYDVTVAEDGTVQVTEATDDGAEDDAAEGDDQDTADGEEEQSTEDEDGEDGEEAAGSEEEGLAADDEVEPLDDDEAAEDDAHGELVSTVAQCAPSGRVAREAGLPNHGFFVRAAAHGESVEFEVDGETLTADLSTPEGAEAFCALATELTEAAGETGTEEDVVEPEDAATTAEGSDADGEGRGKGRSGSAKGGSGDAPGRSGAAPGRAKKDR